MRGRSSMGPDDIYGGPAVICEGNVIYGPEVIYVGKVIYGAGRHLLRERHLWGWTTSMRATSSMGDVIYGDGRHL
jgi:hypothetical protein